MTLTPFDKETFKKISLVHTQYAELARLQKEKQERENRHWGALKAVITRKEKLRKYGK